MHTIYPLWRKLLLSISVVLVLFITACSADIKDYHNRQPEFNLQQFFNGQLIAHGIVQNRQQQVTRRFTATIDASWQDNIGILNEQFLYDDGEQQTRIWTITSHGHGYYTGKAADVVVDATGYQQGYALNWQYTLAIELDNSTYHINFDDWMYLIDETRLINRATMSKWGIEVGQVTLWIEKIATE